MGLIIHKELSPDCTLGIWDITEDYDNLLSRLELTGEDHDHLAAFKNHNRKLEWLSVRALAGELTGRPARIVYNSERKPFLMDHQSNISISHSGNLTSVLLSKKNRVGIDLEYMSHRISKIAHKFINDAEKITRNPAHVRYHLYIHWCAKESLYKICDKQELNFREDLIIEPFTPQDEGILKGLVRRPGQDEEYRLHYFRKDNYIIVWCCK